MSINRFSWQVRPVALPENMITGKQYRFTVLTPCLIRMEYASDGYFEDRASQTAFYRDFPQKSFRFLKDLLFQQIGKFLSRSI